MLRNVRGDYNSLSGAMMTHEDVPEGFLGVDDEVLRSLVEGISVETAVEVAPNPSLKLTVGIGEVQLTVPEICRVEAGDLLPLDVLGEEIVVSFDGVPIFRGELVACEEKFFVRIRNTELDRSDTEGRSSKDDVSR